MSVAIERADERIEQIGDAVAKHAYNCECQAGGVDAMSVDTDWMQAAIRDIKSGWTTLSQYRPRTVTTAGEIAALPVGSVILDREGDAFQRLDPADLRDEPHLCWQYGMMLCSAESIEEHGHFPATVLHEGSAR